MRSLFASPRRAVEAVTVDQLVATGAISGGALDPSDGTVGWRPAGARSLREIPWWTTEKARAYSVNAYRANPMARAIIDTYTAFCVGDSGVVYQATNPLVRQVVDEYWNDPRNRVDPNQSLYLRSHLLTGETVQELMTGPKSGVVRLCPIDPVRVQEIDLYKNNPMWPATIWLDAGPETADAKSYAVMAVNDDTGLREGGAIFWPSFKTLSTDIRGYAFLGPILDNLDSYDTVLSNLVDRTALMRYLAFTVEVQGGPTEVDKFVKNRGGQHIPESGTIEVHNENVKWTPMSASTGAEEDSIAAQSVMTQLAAGAGLAKTWLAEPEGANRATSHTMAEPVRRRVGAVQKEWIDLQTELTRYVVDRAVAARRLPPMVEATDPQTGQKLQMPASQTVTLRGPEIAAADAQITAQVLMNISTALKQMVDAGVLSTEASKVAAKKAWQDYMGVPYTADLDGPTVNPDDVAQAVDDAAPPTPPGEPVPISEALKRRGNAAQLKTYWTRGEGVAKWADTPHPWTALHAELAKYMDDGEAKRTAAQWFHEVKGYWPGDQRGQNPVGHG